MKPLALQLDPEPRPSEKIPTVTPANNLKACLADRDGDRDA